MFPRTKIAVLLQFPDLELKGAHMNLQESEEYSQQKMKDNTPQLGHFERMDRCYMK